MKIKPTALLLTITVSTFLFLFNPKNTKAADSLGWVKNKYGIHVNSNYEDLSKAKDLLNTNGGDWGWITVVIRQDELSQKQWQDFFNHCRRLHLIPLLRLATTAENGVWKKPGKKDVEKMAQFLNRLNWPIQTKFVIIYNEPNRADEWGGASDPKEYFQVLDFAVNYFHQLDPDFFIISAGLDLAAPNQPPKFFSAENFYYQGSLYLPEAMKSVDALASHSYPNHGYIGSPGDTGKTSIKGYQWELKYLKKLGVENNLPVFITETGWPHQEGGGPNHFYPAEKVAELIKTAYQKWDNDSNVIGITPFILNFPFSTFAHFSWLDQNGQPYPQYQSIKNVQKTAQKPPQKEISSITKITISKSLIKKEKITGKVLLINRGQNIWGEDGSFCLLPEKDSQGIVFLSSICLKKGELVEPNQQHLFSFEIGLEEKSSLISFSWQKTGKTEIKKLPNFFWSKTIYPYKKRSWLEKIIGFLKNSFQDRASLRDK